MIKVPDSVQNDEVWQDIVKQINDHIIDMDKSIRCEVRINWDEILHKIRSSLAYKMGFMKGFDK